MYALDTPDAWLKALEFKKSFAIDVKVEFVGIWCVLRLLVMLRTLNKVFRDSVGAVGIRGTGCNFSTTNTNIKTFRHALALDERRARFQANTWRIHRSEGAERNATPTDVEEVWLQGVTLVSPGPNGHSAFQPLMPRFTQM